MKKITVLIGFLFILCTVSIALAGENISGIWIGDFPADNDVSNVQLMYSQIGNNINVIGYFEFKGVPCVWQGTGTIKDSIVQYSVNYSKPYPGWKDAGEKHVLTLSADGKTVIGKWYNNSGESGPAKYIKRK